MVQTRHQEKHERSDEGSPNEEEPTLKQAKRAGKARVDDLSKKGKGVRGRRGSNQYGKKTKDQEDSRQDEQEEGARQPKAKATELAVNRLPVLALWVSVVSECLGFSKDEAYTYGEWVAGTMSHANERQREQYRAKIKESTILDDTGRKEASIVDVDHVQVVGPVNIPVLDVNGKLLAIKGKQVLDPVEARKYLEYVFGDKLETAYNALVKLAKSMKPSELRLRSYELYEKFRPEWKGWGEPGRLDLDEVENMATGNIKNEEEEDSEDEETAEDYGEDED